MKAEADILVEAELERHDWSKMRDSGGVATRVPGALREMLASESPEQVEKAYWKLENVIVVQSQLFEAAAFAVPVIMAALVKSDRPVFVRVWLLELLFQIVNGESHLEEEARGLGDLDKRCKDSAREGLWLVYRELFNKETYDLACVIIRRLDSDNSRLESIEARKPFKW